MTAEQDTAVPIVDSHLDLAENVTFCGRDLTLTALEIRERENRTQEQATVSLPDLQRGGVAVVFATIFAGRSEETSRVGAYSTPQEAEANALDQIELYETWEKQDRVRLIKSVTDLDHHLELWRQDRKPGLVMLMEGADPIVHVQDLPRWWRRGIRMIGLTWGDTKYGAGMRGGSTEFVPGGLTTDGAALLEEMAGLGFIWDISHLTEEGVRQGLAQRHPRVCASHANAQALMPTNRHLSDGIITAVAERGGVIGLVLANDFLDPRWDKDRSIPVTLDSQVRRHAEHMANLAGWNAIGIGSDLDGGTGLEESPLEISTVADLYKVGCIAPAEHREAVLGGNWLRFLRSALPAVN
jgi:membrane dipeptidase